jgi:hypothetical protein
MSDINIIFGSKRLGVEDGSYGSFQKYPEQAVVTLEGVRGKGKSRRLLFNKLAMEALGLENGSVQEIIFGSLIKGDEKVAILANEANIVNSEGLTIYKTSKNAVTYDDSKEKGKAISSTIFTGDLSKFLSLDSDVDQEFNLVDLKSTQIEAMKLVLKVDAPNTIEECSDGLIAQEVEAVPFESPAEVNEGFESEEFAGVDIDAGPGFDSQDEAFAGGTEAEYVPTEPALIGDFG